MRRLGLLFALLLLACSGSSDGSTDTTTDSGAAGDTLRVDDSKSSGSDAASSSDSHSTTDAHATNTHTGTCWGLKVKTGDASSASPKYQGVVDWNAAHP